MSDKSDYEQLRARNIERNNARLRSLGLISALEEQRSNAAAWGRKIKEENVESYPGKKRPRRTCSSEPSRKSRRLEGIAPEGGHIIEDTHKERQERVRECREVRLRAANTIAQQAEQAAKENPTATYEHCLMRVKTMTEKALANRVKVIERAAGKHCVVKMAIFKCCLQDEGMWDLANLASNALERLKALQPPPED